MFGGLGILAGSARIWACIPLSIRLHDGLQATREWEGATVSGDSHVVQMVENAYSAARAFGESLLLLDRYFLTVPVLKRLNALNGSAGANMEIVTKAKRSCIAIGILQILSITFGGELDSSQLRYQRTPSRGRVSEAALMHYMRKYLFLFMEKQPELRITQIIQEQQDTSGIYWDSLAS